MDRPELHEIFWRQFCQLPRPAQRHVVVDSAQAVGHFERSPDYPAVAQQVRQIDIFRQAAAIAKISVPNDLLRSAKVTDGLV